MPQRLEAAHGFESLIAALGALLHPKALAVRTEATLILAGNFVMRCCFAKGGIGSQEPKAASLLRPHLLDHRNHQLTVAVIQIAGVAATLEQQLRLVIGTWRELLTSL